MALHGETNVRLLDRSPSSFKYLRSLGLYWNCFCILAVFKIDSEERNHLSCNSDKKEKTNNESTVNIVSHLRSCTKAMMSPPNAAVPMWNLRTIP